MKHSKIVVSLIVLLSVGIAYAHPASEQTATFDRAKGNLMISFDHKVKDISDHFIYDVKVSVNKKVIITQKVTKQENLNGGTFYYHITDVKAGDKISVVTDCNKTGKKATNVEVK